VQTFNLPYQEDETKVLPSTEHKKAEVRTKMFHLAQKDVKKGKLSIMLMSRADFLLLVSLFTPSRLDMCDYFSACFKAQKPAKMFSTLSILLRDF
jgi:hypothetical protein